MTQASKQNPAAGPQYTTTYSADPGAPPLAPLPDPPPERERIRLYWHVICRIFITLLLIGGIVGVVRSYEMKGLLTRGQKYVYNSFTILLTLLLGINMTIAHSQFVLLIREGIVFTHPRVHSYRAFRFDQKFLKISGLRSSLRFMLGQLKEESKHQGSLRATSIFVLVWVCFSLAVAVAISLIGMTYSLEEGIGRRSGPVSIVNTAHFYVDKNNLEAPETVTERFVSKMYTDVSISYKSATPSKPGKDNEIELEELDDGWQYNFRDTDPSESTMLRSNRRVKTSASCTPMTVQGWDPETLTLTWTDSEGEQQNVTRLSILAFRTVYISGETDGDITRCLNNDPRCGQMFVVQLVDLKDFSNAWVYSCNSTVEEVSGATIPEHRISDNMAVIASTSLSQSGLIDEVDQSFGYYMNRVRWGEIANGDPRKVERMVSRASAGCLAAMDQLNPRVMVNGEQPWTGVYLKVRWPRLIAILVVIGCLHLITATASIIWHRKHLHPSAGSTAMTSVAPVAAIPGPPEPALPPQQHPPYHPSPPPPAFDHQGFGVVHMNNGHGGQVAAIPNSPEPAQPPQQHPPYHSSSPSPTIHQQDLGAPAYYQNAQNIPPHQ